MGRWIISGVTMATLAGVLAFAPAAQAQTPAAPAASAAPTADNAVMITIFLKHDESRPLSELQAQLDKQGFYKAFPPEGIEVVSWYVMMGIGQVVTLRLPASRLREVNRIMENTAWGPLSHRILSDLRLQGGRHRPARQGKIVILRASAN